MKNLVFTVITILVFQTSIAQHSHTKKHNFLYNNTKIELPDGKEVYNWEYEKLNADRIYGIDWDNPKNKDSRYYIAKKNSNKEQKEALKQRDIRSDKYDGESIAMNENKKPISWYEYKKLYDSGNWAKKHKKREDGKFVFWLEKPTNWDKKRIAQDKYEKEIIGKPAPKFTITDMDGNIINSENTKGKVVFLNFWFTTCPPCIEEIPDLNKLYNAFKDNPNVVFASISRDWKERVDKFLLKHPIDMPVSVVSQNNIDVFNVYGFPTNIVIDKKGKIYQFTHGGFHPHGPSITEDIIAALAE